MIRCVPPSARFLLAASMGERRSHAADQKERRMIYIATPGGTRARGGIGRIVSYFTRELSRTPGAPPFAVVDTYGPGSRFMMPLYFAAALVRLLAACALGRASLVHVHMSEYGSVARKGLITALVRLFSVPVVLHLHGANFQEQCEKASLWERRLLRRTLGMASEIVVLGEYWRDFITGFFGPDMPKVTILVNAVEGPEQVPARPVSGAVRILFLGRVGARKGTGELLEALASPPCRDRNWTATIAGDGEVETFRDKAEALGLSDRVTFLGWTDEGRSRELLAQSDMFVLPSRNEGLPVAIVEAMAYGLPVIATPVGSVPTAIDNEVSGLLVPPGDPVPLAAALARLIDDGRLRQSLAGTARKRFERDFDIRIFCNRLIAIYRRNAAWWPA
jgi:glycosyltransferase involved in cell wall biosynthesis